MIQRTKNLINCALVSIGIAASSIAVADPLQIQIVDPNAAIAGFPPPYATVTYDLVDPNTATFTFTAGAGYFLGGVNTAALNFSGGVTLVGAITGTSTCATPYSAAGGGNVSTFGTFNFIVDTFDGANCAGTSLTFTVDLNSGTWADTSAILVANASGNLAAGHIFAGCTGSPPNRTCLNTGFASGDTATPPLLVPEPGTLLLFGLGLLTLVSVRRKSRQ
jgi:hypothetical protein